MHIGFRTSQGRGEYEVVGTHSGYTAASLEGWSFFMLWPDGVARDTNLWLDPAGSGKPRLRSLVKPPIQIGRIVAPMLLLPDPTRSRDSARAEVPIIRAKNFAVTQVGFSPESDFAGAADRVTFKPSWIEVANPAGTEAIGVESRWRRIQAVYADLGKLPVDVAACMANHQAKLSSGQPIDSSLTSIVTRLRGALAEVRGLGYGRDYDPLPALEQLLGIPVYDGPSLPPPNELSEDEPEISTRAAFQYRLSKIRGATGKAFSLEVRTAYGHRCAFCGARLSGLDGIPAGIDAAHILAWSKHDLDVVSNGIALCKLHHWAFDASIMMPVQDNGRYSVQFTTLADRLDSFSLARLGDEGMLIKDEWLPADPAHRPSAKYLQLLYADLGVSFREEFR
ncbi:hypothetical protein GCM10027030_26470 [Luteococcus sediminum]